MSPKSVATLPYPSYGRSGARPIRWSRSPESLSEFSVPLLPNTHLPTSLSFSLTQFVLKFLNRRQGAFQFFWKRGGKLIFGDADRF
jgi:hypothetical protein